MEPTASPVTFRVLWSDAFGRSKGEQSAVVVNISRDRVHLQSSKHSPGFRVIALQLWSALKAAGNDVAELDKVTVVWIIEAAPVTSHQMLFVTRVSKRVLCSMKQIVFPCGENMADKLFCRLQTAFSTLTFWR